MKARSAYKITGVLAAIAAATALSAAAQDTTTTPTDPSATVPSQATVPGSVAPSTTPAPTVEAPNTTATPNPTAEPAVEAPAAPPANPDAATGDVAQTTQEAAPADAAAPKTFMQQAFLANEFSKAAAELALQKGSTQEVKETAQSVLADATKTRAAMVTAIQTSTSDMSFDQNWNEDYKQKLADLNTLQGAEFDAKYLELQGQVSNDIETLYRSFAATASDDATKTFAAATLPTLTAQNDALESVSQGGQ